MSPKPQIAGEAHNALFNERDAGVMKVASLWFISDFLGAVGDSDELSPCSWHIVFRRLASGEPVMPIAYQFDRAKVLLEVFATGFVTVDDRTSFVATALADADLPSPMPILIDVSGLENPPSSVDVPRMARLIEVLSARFNSRIAYFVTGVGIVTPYLLASYEVRTELAEARTFTSRVEAIKWLKGF